MLRNHLWQHLVTDYFLLPLIINIADLLKFDVQKAILSGGSASTGISQGGQHAPDLTRPPAFNSKTFPSLRGAISAGMTCTFYYFFINLIPDLPGST